VLFDHNLLLIIRQKNVAGQFGFDSALNQQVFGRGGEIRTPDPHNPIVVRYQAALRPDTFKLD